MKLAMLLVFILGGNGKTTQDGCNIKEFNTCISKNFRGDRNIRFGGLSESLENLILTCRKFYKGMDCIENFYERCQNLVQRKYIEKQIAGARIAMSHLCPGEDIKQVNQTYDSCYRDLNTNISECIKPLQRLPRHGKEENRKDLCCARNVTLNCVISAVRKTCNQKAVKFAQLMLQMVTPSLNSTCAAISDDYCSGSKMFFLINSAFGVCVVTFLILIFHTHWCFCS
ncbi:uncharacterized protein LOC111086900 [Limulus polyphemus]|uniref:Uncharacterized protein LOC111086900 n=1 Tax=Limulus polyphemus TaxID=6850 RepID=A0ABM1SUN3_LIMPO|nr:uncharacterized protein LOC111086900 [Limulus polyphemus]